MVSGPLVPIRPPIPIPLSLGEMSWVAAGKFSCPHCKREQVVPTLTGDFGPIAIRITQCMACHELMVFASAFQMHKGLPDTRWQRRLHPLAQQRPPRTFIYCEADVKRAYEDACMLFGIHPGAAGAYARRALELILDLSGYRAKSLFDSIELAAKEGDPDKKLPKRLRDKLDYVKEIGNFALHIRRDGELGIVEIAPDEVEACLETIEELIQLLFDDPVRDYQRVVELNQKLAASDKKLIRLPDLPAGYLFPGDGVPGDKGDGPAAGIKPAPKGQPA